MFQNTTRLAILVLMSSVSLAAESLADERPNVVLICVDDLRPELNCFGVDYIHSPNIDALAAKGVRYTRHYVQAPTCGASRYALLTGLYGPASNAALFARADAMRDNSNSDKLAVHPSLPAWFRQHGYQTVSVGKVSHHPGGRGGTDWNDDKQPEMPEAWDRHLLPAGAWQHPRGWMHGLAHGEIRKKASDMDLFQSIEGEDSIYPDGISTNEALHQLDELASQPDQPFFLAFGILRPHLPFGAPAKYMNHYRDVELPTLSNMGRPQHRTTWHSSGEFMKYNRWGRDPNTDKAFAVEVRRHYAACVSFADAQVGKVIEKLDALGLTDNTIVILWGDHGWHLGEHAIWGKHALFEESLRSPLIVVSQHAKKAAIKTATESLNGDAIADASGTSVSVPGSMVTDVVETVDIYPTLCELAAIPTPDFLQGSSLLRKSHTAFENSGEAVSYFKKAKTLRTDRYRIIVHSDGYAELYDHISDKGETKNIAGDHPKLVNELSSRLLEKFGVIP